MEKEKLMCIRKEKDASGNNVGWILADRYGNTNHYDRKEITKELKNKKFDIVNLQISSDGKIVDKAIPHENEEINKITAKGKSNNITDIFDAAYGMLIKQCNITITRKPNGEVVMTEPFDRIPKGINIDRLSVDFENYIHNKYNAKLLKIDVLNRRTGRRYIHYGIGYVEDFPCDAEIKNAETVSNYAIKCNSNNGKKIVGKMKNKSGQITNDAYLGTIAYDETNAEAVKWAKKRTAELEKYLYREDKAGTTANSNKGSKQGNTKKSTTNKKNTKNGKTSFKEKFKNFIRRFFPYF